ncbi:MAG: iron-sulfur cluster repair di-iron protein, partial [Chitinophagaceae bacterium]
VATKHGDRFPFMKDVYLLFAEVQNEMTQHMLKEERILFPRIKQLEQNALVLDDINYFQGPIDVMIEDHDLAGNLLQQIRKLTNDYTAPEGACTTFRLSLASLQAFEGDLHRHVHVENHVLFPRTIALYQKLAKSTAC